MGKYNIVVFAGDCCGPEVRPRITSGWQGQLMVVIQVAAEGIKVCSSSLQEEEEEEEKKKH